jgi:hypothetical protein
MHLAGLIVVNWPKVENASRVFGCLRGQVDQAVAQALGQIAINHCPVPVNQVEKGEDLIHHDVVRLEVAVQHAL